MPTNKELSTALSESKKALKASNRRVLELEKQVADAAKHRDLVQRHVDSAADDRIEAAENERDSAVQALTEAQEKIADLEDSFAQMTSAMAKLATGEITSVAEATLVAQIEGLEKVNFDLDAERVALRKQLAEAAVPGGNPLGTDPTADFIAYLRDVFRQGQNGTQFSFQVIIQQLYRTVMHRYHETTFRRAKHCQDNKLALMSSATDEVGLNQRTRAEYIRDSMTDELMGLKGVGAQLGSFMRANAIKPYQTKLTLKDYLEERIAGYEQVVAQQANVMSDMRGGDATHTPSTEVNPQTGEWQPSCDAHELDRPVDDTGASHMVQH